MKKMSLKLVCLVFAVSLFAGCGTVKNALYETKSEETVLQEYHVALASGELVTVPMYRAQFGVEPAAGQLIAPGTRVLTETIQPREEVEAVVRVVRHLPIPFADVAGTLLLGALGVGSIALGRGRSIYKKSATVLAKGVDTFRDVLDQTEAGEKIDARLQAVLRESAEAQGAVDSVSALLGRYTTADKPAGYVAGIALK